MMERAIAIDVDGTLLNSQGRLGRKTKDVLRRLSPTSLIILASGRPRRSMLKLRFELGIDCALICYNGALTFDCSLNVLERKTLPIDSLYRIFHACSSFLSSFAIETEADIYSYIEDRYLSRYFPFEGMRIHLGPGHKLPEDGVMACLMRCPHRHDKELKEAVIREKGLRFRHWTSSTYSEVSRDDCDKATALKGLLSLYGIETGNCYAFGDSTNDYCLLKASGHPFAMANSKAEALKGFPRTEKGNAEEGVALTLQKLFL